MTTTMAPKSKLPPRPPGAALFGHVRQWRKDPVKLITDAARYGNVVQLAMPGKTYLLNHPAHVKHVLQDNHQNYCKGWVFDRIKPYWGESLLTADGDTWRRQRRRVQPSFKREHTVDFAPIITRRTAEMLARWETISESGQELALYQETTELALVIIADILFNVELWENVSEIIAAVQSALRVLKKRVAALAPVPLWIPTRDNRSFNHAMRTLNSKVSDVIEGTRTAAGPRSSFVTMLMEARDADTGERMSDTHLHQEVIGMLQQGHDTIGETLAWTWYLLSRHPEAERKLADEVQRVLGGRTPVVADLEHLPFATMVIQESLRLFPPVWIIPRDAIADDEIDGYRIPAGATVLLCPYLTHRHPAFWDNPEVFDPERFNPEIAKGRPRYAYFPFGGGPRLCMGADMAMMETLLILAMMAQRYSIHLVPGHCEEPECLIDMVPRHGVHVTLRKTPRVLANSDVVKSHGEPPRAARNAAAAMAGCPWHGAQVGLG